MKKLCLLICFLVFASGAMAQLPTPLADDGFEKLSPATAQEFPGVTLEIALQKQSFQVGEMIAVTFTYRNESAAPVKFTRGNSSVEREFRARQLDGDALFQSKPSGGWFGSDLVREEMVEPHASVSEIFILNGWFFLKTVGRYELTSWTKAISLGGKQRWLQSAPIELQIVPATEAFQTQVLNQAKTQIEAALKISRGRLLSSFPREMDVAEFAAERLEWLQDERAIPILVAALEIGNNYQYSAERALREYPREQVRAVMQQRLAEPEPIISGRRIWLELGADSPDEKAQMETQLDNRFRAALEAATDPLQRGTLALGGLVDSPALRREPKFWHEALTNIGGENQGSGFYSLLSVPSAAQKTRVAEYPIATADLKTALETAKPFQTRIMFFHALEERDAAFLRQFLLARVDNYGFDYPRGAFDVFSDAQLKSVVAKLIAAIQSSKYDTDTGWRDEFGRRLRDVALRGASIEDLELVESWLLQNTPSADAPILDVIALKAPSRAWFWMEKSLTKRPLETRGDNRMYALVLLKDKGARAFVRDLLQNGSQQNRLRVLSAIASTSAKPFQPESQTRWQSGEQFFPRAKTDTFDDLQNDLQKLAAPESDALKQAAIKALAAIADLKTFTYLPD